MATTSAYDAHVTTAPDAFRARLAAGRILTALAALFLAFDGVARAVHFQPYLEGTLHAGYEAGMALPIGLLLVVCTALYVFPATTVVGAILLTAYLGAATATNLRVGDPWIFPVIMAVWVWAGVWLREPRLADAVLRR
jgi:hypothetical protein